MAHVIHDYYVNPPRDEEGLLCLDPSRTVQESKDECDINVIMSRYQKMGVMPEGVGVGSYGDFASAPDFIEAQNLLIHARQQFDALPSRVRDRFANDPVRLLEFLAKKENFDEAVNLGLLADEAKKVQDAKATLEAVAVAAPAPSK